MRTETPRRSDLVPLDVLAAVQALGLDVDRVQNNEAWALCPAHDDHKPSWSVNLDTGRHNCFSCGWRGSFFTLVKRLTGQDDEYIGQWIRREGGYVAVRDRFLGKDRGSPQKEPEKVTEVHLALFVPPPAPALEERGVSAESCERYGVLWDPKEDRWVFPIRDPLTYGLRGWQEKSKRVFKNHPRGVVKKDTLFGIDVFEGPRAVVVESPLDAVYLHTLGISGAVASFGAGLSDEQVRTMTLVSKEIIWALDNDRAGEENSAWVQKNYLGTHRMSFFDYGDLCQKDPGTMTREEVYRGIENAIPSYRVKFAYAGR